jgi:hypothetical protein
MNTIFVYIIQVNISLALFYLLYIGLLKRDTFLKMRRMYFLFAIAFSLLYPMFTIEWIGDAFSTDKSLPELAVTATSIDVGEFTMSADVVK